MKKCRVCGVDDTQKPAIFRGEPYCCDRHRKVIAGEISPTNDEWVTMDAELGDMLAHRLPLEEG